MLFALFRVGGHHYCPSLVLSFLGNSGTTRRLDKSNVPFPPILNTFHSGAFCNVLNFSNGCYMCIEKARGSSSYEKKG
jgi:hypothetical protein